MKHWVWGDEEMIRRHLSSLVLMVALLVAMSAPFVFFPAAVLVVAARYAWLQRPWEG